MCCSPHDKHALSIIYPLRAIAGISRFRVTQHEDYAVTVDVVCDDRTERVTPDAVAASVRPVLGPEVGLRVDLVDRIAPAESGKYRYVVSHAAGGPRRHAEEGTKIDA